MNIEVKQYGDRWHVVTPNSRFGLGSWAAFRVEHVARNFAAWLEAQGDIQGLGERVATGRMTADDHRLKALILIRTRHAAQVIRGAKSIFEIVNGS